VGASAEAAWNLRIDMAIGIGRMRGEACDVLRAAGVDLVICNL
jgi:hypothetical protein